MQDYISQIHNIINPSFKEIRNIAIQDKIFLNEKSKRGLYSELKRGVDLLDSHELLCQYFWSFGNMHEAKIHDAVKRLPRNLFNNDVEIIDWGCGQGIGTMCFLDFIKNQGYKGEVKKITLIEPSQKALERAGLHVNAYIDEKSKITFLPKYLDDVTVNDIKSDGNNPVIHFFSNILDIPQIDLKELAKKIDNTVIEDNYIVSIGPLYSGSRRIDAFHDYYNVPLIYDFEDSQFDYGGNSTCSYKAKVYKLEYNSKGNLIPIEYYPAVQFHASYQLDGVNQNFKNSSNKGIISINERLNLFETSTPFDIGASVYDDINPVYAVLNNIITRGLPTKASPFVERVFKDAFGYSEESEYYGTLSFPQIKPVNIDSLLNWYDSIIKEDTVLDFNTKDIEQLQLIFSPVAISRIQKTILEALMTGKLDITNKTWKVLVEEKDVPGAAIAFQDLSYIFNNLTKLSPKFDELVFPKIQLDIISNETFCNSKLHIGNDVSQKEKPKHLKTEYDLVIDISIFQISHIKKDSFSKFRCKNKCYFNLRSAIKVRRERCIYTTDTISYKPLVSANGRGEYTDIPESKELLEYFLQLLFRKVSFRDGQLPILNRALQNKSVIGLLPTGGGKSLTYQLAAMLQPGITLIVDPLRSLMKDQYDGLINVGIDACAYINSTLSKEEKENAERQMEQSKLLFVFLSPERLAIYKFRKKLKNMHELNVYFSYGVIDEVHCVSEWGHDFRFSYLHLGRNLKNYVRGKNEYISLFGLTATASFDVLADVERELSGNGTFPLDSETIVRYENTNRLELQYKIEKVHVEFDDEYEALKKSKFATPDKLKAIENKYKPLIDNGFSIPVKVADKWGFFEAKQDFLTNYIKTIPSYLNELQSNDSIARIKNTFEERQRNSIGINADLEVDITNDYYSLKENYDQAGIVFCPHKGGTGISVQKNKDSLGAFIPKVGTFSGGDEDEHGTSSMENLELFRTNKQPLMIATKAFGMGIDKPNVRFTVNLNYSSSLESFVQEAGRGGRDRKMALAVILLSDYKLARINKKYPNDSYPLGIIKGKWFKHDELLRIISHYRFDVQENHINYLTPENDLVRLFCKEGTKAKYFGFNSCSDTKCYQFKRCKLRSVPKEAEGWNYKPDLDELLRENNLKIDKKYIEYQNADYETVMYFYNNSFKGELIERQSMFQILNVKNIDVFYGDDIETKPNDTQTVKGFLASLLNANENQEIVSFIDYKNTLQVNGDIIDQTDIAKAIYRMTCIELIEDFTQDYNNERYRIVAKRKKEGRYYEGLKRFLLRYYSFDRAEEEIKKVYNIELRNQVSSDIEKEIFQCLSFLTTFVYEKISVKRKRAIDDIRTFCITGINDNKDWKETNEELKDFIYYYFNSKYAKTDYIADNGKPYSMTIDTDDGKKSEEWILFKFLKVIDEKVEDGTAIDNVKHLQGAVRLIRRSLTDDNPTLSLLNTFCIFFLGTNNNKNLENESIESYEEGMIGFANRANDLNTFWEFFKKYNSIIKPFTNGRLKELKNEITLKVHSNELKKITSTYTR